MRILFITRIHPAKHLGPIEARLHSRLTELSELGHDVLVLTKWSVEPVDFALPSRIEVRSPFKKFRLWEVAQILPMIFAWRPDLLHLFDSGFSPLDRKTSAEMMTLTLLETMRRASNGRAGYRGALVSVQKEKRSPVEMSWLGAGATRTENEWLRPVVTLPTREPWDHASGRKIQVVLAGHIGVDRPISVVFDALNAMRTLPDIELTVYLDRSSLSQHDRCRLGLAERQHQETNHGAVGSRLRVVAPDFFSPFDVAIVAGLDNDSALSWVEQLPMPLILSEMQVQTLSLIDRHGTRCQVIQPLVSEIAPIAQALRLASNRALLISVWSEIEHDGLAAARDTAANHISRMYSQIAGMNSSS